MYVNNSFKNMLSEVQAWILKNNNKNMQTILKNLSIETISLNNMGS